MKIKMTCARCGFSATWYKFWWHEVMDYKINDSNYICSDCAKELENEAVQKYIRGIK